MLQVFALLVPALIPSWRFFKSIEPSPRVECRWLNHRSDQTPQWLQFAPRPATLPLVTLARRLFWNPRWNEKLYLVTLAERLSAEPTPHSVDEINRILGSKASRKDAARFVQFRLVFLHREGTEIVREVTYISKPHEL